MLSNQDLFPLELTGAHFVQIFAVYNAQIMGDGMTFFEGKSESIYIISVDAIEEMLERLAREINADMLEKSPVFIGVLKGSFIFLADLSRRLTIPRTIEFIAVSSYGSGSKSGAVRLVMDVRGNIEGRHVLIVEDIVDTGHTLKYLIGVLGSHRPASIKTAALLHKPARAEVDVPIDYVGFGIGDEWVVGYGLDYAEHERTLPYIGIIRPTD